MQRYRITLEYDGTDYQGWQTQPRGVTIQGLVEDALRKVTGAAVAVAGSGRTDAGVHALGQVASFDADTRLVPETLRRAINANLPGDVRVTEAAGAPPGFHARFSAKGKRYVYIVANGQDVSVFARRHAWWVRRRLDIAAMEEAARHLVGRHDFSSFRGGGCTAQLPVRDISNASVESAPDTPFLSLRLPSGLIRLSFEADGFLRYMVRNMVGTLVEVGAGRLSPGEFKEVLELRDRRCAGLTAPAQGLFLEAVRY